MGRKGPAPRPGTLRLLVGERPARRGNEPVPPPGDPVQPEEVDEAAAEVWNEVVPQLVAMGVVRRVDESVLWSFCCIEATRRRLAVMVAGSSPLIATRNKNGDAPALVRNPLMAMLRDYSALSVRIAAELGLSPRGRAELRFLTPAEPNELERLLS